MITNLMREGRDRSLNAGRHIAFVVANDDSQHPDGQRIQRVQMRLPELDDGVPDSDLAWYTPGAADSYSGGSDVGSHGPIPPIGARLYVTHEDDTRYHGQYHGGVAHTDNQIAEFTKPQGSSGTDASTDADANSTTGDQATDLQQPQGYDFTKNYPAPYGSINSSGDFHGHDPKTDYTEHTAVSGTGWSRDGKGNLKFIVNGNASTGNKNADASIPEGLSASVFGNGTLYLSKGMTLTVTGDGTIHAGGNLTIQAGGDAIISANGKASVSAKGDINVTSGGTTKLSGHKIVLVGVTIELAGTVIGPVPSGSSSATADIPASVEAVTAQTAPTVRKRPAATAPTNDTSY